MKPVIRELPVPLPKTSRRSRLRVLFPQRTVARQAKRGKKAPKRGGVRQVRIGTKEIKSNSFRRIGG